MFEKTETIDGVTFTVHSETGRDVIAKRYLYPKVITEGLEWELWYQFFRVLVQSTDVTVPFAWPQMTDSVEVLQTARDEWYKLSGDVIRRWLKAIDDVDTPPGEPDLSPGADPKGEAIPESPTVEERSA